MMCDCLVTTCDPEAEEHSRIPLIFLIVAGSFASSGSAHLWLIYRMMSRCYLRHSRFRGRQLSV